MALDVGSLTGELVKLYEKGPKGNSDPKEVGRETGKAYMNFCSKAMDSGGGKFVSMSGASDLGKNLGNIYNKESIGGALTAEAIATEFNNCLLTFKTDQQLVIITSTGYPMMIMGLIGVFSAPNTSAAQYAQKLAMEIASFTMMAIVSGLIPGAPPVPYTGPLI